MGISSVVVAANIFNFNCSSEGSSASCILSYPIEAGSDGEKYIVCPDAHEFNCLLNDIEVCFGPVNLGAYCFGGDWDDNALHLGEIISFMKEHEIPVINHNSEE